MLNELRAKCHSLGSRCSGAAIIVRMQKLGSMKHARMNRLWTRMFVPLLAVVAILWTLIPWAQPWREARSDPAIDVELPAISLVQNGTAPVIVAQGKILPRGGIVEISAPPGDVIQQVLVEVGQHIEPGEKLLVMASESARERQIEALQAALEAGRFGQQQAVAAAQQQVEAARLELKRLAAARQGLDRRRELIDLAQKQLETAQLALNKLERIARDESLKGFVDETELLRQRMAVQEAERELLEKRIALEEAEQQVRWGNEAAELQLRGAEQALAAAQKGFDVQRLETELQAAQAQFEASLVRSPLDGVVLAVDVQAGEAGTGMPALACADVDQLICQAEVNVIDAGLVQPGARVEIQSPAFAGRVLHGTVRTRHPLVGTPLLKPLNPLARTDFRAVKVDIDIDREDCPPASQWLQLQVEVTIARGAPGPAETGSSM
ncbi:MAG: HlyD family efflux transporter periplasmic adaptor subunit [Planctomycetota bacterium]|nr:MAG: HlyD family efflux transporter periplasmic adaptor subunit [Planctomycetota bacterium]